MPTPGQIRPLRPTYNRADYRLKPSQWETSSQYNVVSHWLGANLESALIYYTSKRVHKFGNQLTLGVQNIFQKAIISSIYFLLKKTGTWNPCSWMKMEMLDTKLAFFNVVTSIGFLSSHDGVIKWKHFPRYWSFGRGIFRSSGNSPHKGQWRGTLMFSLICAWTNGHSLNNRDTGDWRRHRAHYDVTVTRPVQPCRTAVFCQLRNVFYI